MKRSMISVAYDLLKKKRNATPFLKLWKEVSEEIGFNAQQEEDNIAQFYSDLSLDDRFVNVGENKWDLRSRHTYSEVVIDTEDIIIDEEVEEEELQNEILDKKDEY